MIKSEKYKTSKHAFVGRGEQIRTAVYPGSSGSVTLGHYDIIERTAKMVDKLIIGILSNKAECPLFSAQERADMLKEVTSSLPDMGIQSFGDLPTDFVHRSHANIVVREPRVITDFEYRLQMAQTSRVITSEIDTIFLTTSLRYSYLSSSIVKEIAEYEEDISEFLHLATVARVREKLEERRRLA